MNVLVVGGAGFLGQKTVGTLLHNGHSVTVVDALLYDDEYREYGATWVPGDVTDKIDQAYMARALFPQADAIIWLAAIVGDKACAVDPDYTRTVNVEAVRFLADSWPQGKPILFTSSCSVYGQMPEGGEATEEAPLRPLSGYAETKCEAEDILLHSGQKAMILRLGTLHGVSGRMRFDLVVNAMARDAYRFGHITVAGGGQSRPFVSVRDVANLLDLAAWGDWRPGVYNVASENLTIREVADKVASEGIEHDIQIVEAKLPEGQAPDPRNYRVSSGKLTREFTTPNGYERFLAKHGVRDSAFQIADLLDSGRIKDPYSVRYNNYAMAMLRRMVRDQAAHEAETEGVVAR